MSGEYLLIVQAKDGRRIEKKFDSMQDLEAFAQKCIEWSGAKMELKEFIKGSEHRLGIHVYKEKK